MSEKPAQTAMTPEQQADAILRAAGSSLANYTMPGTRAAILAAVQAVRDDECGQFACRDIAHALEAAEALAAYRAATRGEG